MENVRFFPLMPEEEMPSLLNAADLHLVLQRRGAADLVMPSKLAAILAVGGRALVTADAATELGILAGENPGIYEMVSPEDEEALSRAVERAAGWPSTPCLPARAYAVEHLSRTGILGALEKDLSSLAAR
jgi:colanic acid biosynthesis glycosyl transferase WcaI